MSKIATVLTVAHLHHQMTRLVKQYHGMSEQERQQPKGREVYTELKRINEQVLTIQ